VLKTPPVSDITGDDVVSRKTVVTVTLNPVAVPRTKKTNAFQFSPHVTRVQCA